MNIIDVLALISLSLFANTAVMIVLFSLVITVFIVQEGISDYRENIRDTGFRTRRGD